ncbi:MAG: hypothetical protein AAGI71_00410 [Bacteroidota bacterium]
MTRWPAALLLALPLLLGGCRAMLYTPHPHVIPLFEERGQLHVAAGLRHNAGIDLNLATSPLPHTFVFASWAQVQRDRFEQRYAEAGGGLYVRLPARSTLEVLGGLSRGQSEGRGERALEADGALPPFESFRYAAAYDRSYVQVNVGTRSGNGEITLGGALRLSRVRFSDVETEPDLSVSWVRGHYLEPALVIRTRVNRFVDVEGQLGSSYSLGQQGWSSLFSRERRYGGLGVRLHVGRK